MFTMIRLIIQLHAEGIFMQTVLKSITNNVTTITSCYNIRKFIKIVWLKEESKLIGKINV